MFHWRQFVRNKTGGTSTATGRWCSGPGSSREAADSSSGFKGRTKSVGPQVGWESVKEDAKDSCLSTRKDGVATF